MNISVTIDERYAEIIRKRLPHGVRKIFYRSLIENFAKKIEHRDEDFMRNLLKGFYDIQSQVIDQQIDGMSEVADNGPI